MKIPRINFEEIATRNGISADEVGKIIALISKGMKPVHRQFLIREGDEVRKLTVIRRGVGSLKTPCGPFWQYDFFINDCWKKYSVLARGSLSSDFVPVFDDPNRIFLRVDSGCESGQKFIDMTCDCRDQLLFAMQQIEKIGGGIIINIPHQDGRGMGNPFKLATLSLQEQLHLSTVEASSILTDGNPFDKRTYGGVIAILKFFRVPQKCTLCLITNNPNKLKVFDENGYRTIERIPAIIPPTQHTRRHLESKQLYLGHKDLVSDKGAS